MFGWVVRREPQHLRSCSRLLRTPTGIVGQTPGTMLVRICWLPSIVSTKTASCLMVALASTCWSEQEMIGTRNEVTDVARDKSGDAIHESFSAALDALVDHIRHD